MQINVTTMEKTENLIFRISIGFVLAFIIVGALMPIGGMNPETKNYSPILSWLMTGILVGGSVWTVFAIMITVYKSRE